MNRLYLAVFSAAFLFVFADARAQESTMAESGKTGWYVAGRVGAVFPTNDEYENAFAGQVAVGHRKGKFQIESELGYSKIDFKSFSGLVNDIPVSGTGTTKVLTIMVHAYLRPWDRGGDSSAIQPYFGIGAGTAHYTHTVTGTAEVLGSQVTVSAEDSDTDLVIAGTIGAEFMVNENLYIGPAYRYLLINSDPESVKAHNLLFSIRHEF